MPLMQAYLLESLKCLPEWRNICWNCPMCVCVIWSPYLMVIYFIPFLLHHARWQSSTCTIVLIYVSPSALHPLQWGSTDVCGAADRKGAWEDGCHVSSFSHEKRNHFLAHGATTNHHLASLLHTWRIIPLSSFIFTSIVYSNVFKLEKRKTHGKSKNKTSKLKKKKQNKWEKKGTSKRVKKMEKMDLSICICVVFLFFDLCFFAFIFFAWKKTKQIEKTKIKKCKWTSPHFPHFFYLFVFPGFPLFPFILFLCFLDFADLLFVVSFFCCFFRVFFKF